jgi:hypothetical protein
MDIEEYEFLMILELIIIIRDLIQKKNIKKLQGLYDDYLNQYPDIELIMDNIDDEYPGFTQRVREEFKSLKIPQCTEIDPQQ